MLRELNVFGCVLFLAAAACGDNSGQNAAANGEAGAAGESAGSPAADGGKGGAGGAGHAAAGQGGSTGRAGAGAQAGASGREDQAGASGGAGRAGASGQAGQAGAGGQAGHAGAAGQAGHAGAAGSGGASGHAGSAGQAGASGGAGAGGGPGFAAVQAIFDTHCVLCHDASKQNIPAYPALPLTADVAYVTLVSKPANETCGGTLVVPGDPAHSYLVHKLTDDTPCEGDHMPRRFEGGPGPRPSLTQDELDTITHWIMSGAGH